MWCGKSFQEEQTTPKPSLYMDRRRALGIGGSLLLALGVFMPIVSLGAFGSMDYFRGGSGDGVFVLLFSGASLILVLFGYYEHLVFAIVPAAGIVVYTFVTLQGSMASLQSDTSNPFAHAIGPSWGWLVLLAGLFVLSWAGIPTKRLSTDASM